jgi:hypothetical protein
MGIHGRATLFETATRLSVTDFFLPGDVRDERYRILRDDDFEIVREGRQFVEEIWRECAPYVDLDLHVRARESYLPRFWELYVAYTLLTRGLTLVPREGRRVRVKGPDLLLGDGITWVEAVLPTGGSGPDAIKEIEPGTAGWVPHDALKLRLLSAIRAKLGKYHRYLETNVLTPTDRYVVAVGGCAISSAKREQTIPRIVSSVLPFGAEQVHLDAMSLQVIGHSFMHQPSVRKESGAQVSTMLFQDPASSPISALLYAWSDEINRPVSPGSEYIIVHNPLAANPLPLGYFPFGTEYWFQGEKLHFQKRETVNSPI